MLESQLKKLNNRCTCSITHPQEGAVAFVRSEKHLFVILGTEAYGKNIMVLAPENLENKHEVPDNIKIIYVENPEYVFTLHHNLVNKNTLIPEPTIGANCKIHETVVLNIEGLKVVNAPDKSKIQFRHTGNIIIGDNVEMGPYCVIHRGTMDSTVIGNGVKMAAMNNIGHNNIIGNDTIFGAGVITNGSVTIGKSCWISSGVMIKNGVGICNNVVLGMGTAVVKDINLSGIYVGSPAKKIKNYEEGWNF